MKVYDRYAQAFFELSKTEKEISNALYIKNFLSKEVASFLNNPIIDTEHKKEIVSTIATTEVLKNFLNFMLDKKRFDFTSFIEALEKLSDKKNQIIRGKAVTAFELSSKLKNTLEATFFKKISKKVIFEYEIDNSILGGIRVEIGGIIFEDTLINKLNKIKNL